MSIVGLLFSTQSLQAQDVSFSQYSSNRLYLNPALTGIEKDIQRVFLNYRNQWPGLGGSFVSYSASYDQYVEALHGGLGMRIFNDNQGGGALQEYSISLDYSYHLKVSRKFSINAGFEASYVQKSLQTSDFQLADNFDPLTGTFIPYSNGNQKVAFPDFTVGFAGFFDNYYGGISVSHILKPSLALNSDPNNAIPRKVMMFIGGIIPVYEKRFGKEVVQLSPSLFYMQQAAFSQLTYGMEAIFQNQLLAGISLRQNLGVQFSSLIFSAGYVTKKIRLRYSYDQQLSTPVVQLPNLGTHEISCVLSFGSVKKIKHKAIKCPKI